MLPGNQRKTFFFTAGEENNFPKGTLFRTVECGKIRIMPGVDGPKAVILNRIPGSEWQFWKLGRKNFPYNKIYRKEVLL